MTKNILWVLILLFICGCEGKSQFQKDVDKSTQAFARTGRTFVNFFKDDLNNCENFIKIYEEITEEVQVCDNEGTFQVTKLLVDCQDAAPIIATAQFLLEQDNCEDSNTDVTSTGPLNINLSFSAEGNIAFMSSEGIEVRGNLFNYEKLRVKIEFANNSLSCRDSEDLTVNEIQNCSVTSDCQDCDF